MKNLEVFFDNNSVYIRVASNNKAERDKILKSLTDLLMFDKKPEELKGIEETKIEKPVIPETAQPLKVRDFKYEAELFHRLKFCENKKERYALLREFGPITKKLVSISGNEQNSFTEAFASAFASDPDFALKSKTDTDRFKETMDFLKREFNKIVQEYKTKKEA